MWKVQYYKDRKLAHEMEVDQPHAHDALMFGHHEKANQADYVVMVRDGVEPPLTPEELHAAELEEAQAKVRQISERGAVPAYNPRGIILTGGV